MRLLDPAKLQEVRDALAEQHMPSAQETALLHQAEIWRDRLIADDDAVGQWINISPSADSQQLRALVRQARKDAKPEKPGEAQRHGRAYRDIFQLVREQLTAAHEQPDKPSADAADEGYDGEDA
jgi:ribosome-associated protein